MMRWFRFGADNFSKQFARGTGSPLRHITNPNTGTMLVLTGDITTMQKKPSAAAHQSIEPTFNYSANKRVTCTWCEMCEAFTTQCCNARRHQFNYFTAHIECICICISDMRPELSVAVCLRRVCEINAIGVCINIGHECATTSNTNTRASAPVVLDSVAMCAAGERCDCVLVCAIVTRFDHDYCGQIFNILWVFVGAPSIVGEIGSAKIIRTMDWTWQLHWLELN